MVFLLPVLIITDMVFVLLLKLLAIYFKVLTKMEATYWLAIQIPLLKKPQTLWSCGFLIVLSSSLY